MITGNSIVSVLKTLAPLATIRLDALKASDVVAVGRVFGADITQSTAEKVSQGASRFSQDPDATLLDFVINGGLVQMMANAKPVLPGDLIRRCPHCDELLIPNLE